MTILLSLAIVVERTIDVPAATEPGTTSQSLRYIYYSSLGLEKSWLDYED
jgi:hypothetical protein